MASVKPETNPDIKLEAVASTPADLEDVDEFEDDTDLMIPTGKGNAWLVKLPTYLWKSWSEMYKEAPEGTRIEIGRMRVSSTPGASGERKVQMRLDEKVASHQDLPKNYDVRIGTNGYSNVVVFSEKDLPGHKSQLLGHRSRLSAPRPSGIQTKGERYGHVKPGTYRTAIPKQTALSVPVEHVADANPVEDESYYQHFEKIYKASLQPKKTTTFQTGIDRRMQPGVANLADFASFRITSRPGGVKNKKKTPREKAVRISQEALLDALYQCFRRYKYWSLKALKNELKQPEQYIKQTLDGIATLVRSGDFAATYMLNPEYASIANIRPEEVKEETAAVKSEIESDSGSGDDMDDDDAGDFEDVKMEGDGG